jgi:Protein kinase domain
MTPAPPGYELFEELGQGATGTVHLARHVALGREVAIKRIVGGASSQDPETVLRFERQARLLARLDHPGIVRVHEVVRLGADLFLVTEHVPGGDLRRVLADGTPPPSVAAGILGDVAAALDHAHEHGVVHGDLKPANVLLTGDGRIKVGDFGLAALLERQARTRAGRARAVESLAYMAPELARGDLVIDRRADVYSLGAIAYEMLVGRVPFPVVAGDPYAMVRAQMEDPPPKPASLVPGFPPLLEATLLWALEKPPERRPASAGELAAALRDALRHSPTIGAYTADGGRGRAHPVAAAVPAAAASGAHAERPPAGWRTPAALVLAGVLLGVTGVVVAGRILQPPAGPTALAVTGVTAAADPADGAGRCPRSTITVRATVATNGAAGTISYEWLRPDGRRSAVDRARVREGVRGTTVSLALGYDGGTPAQGVAALHVLAPASVYSPPVRVAYSCP